MSELWPTTLTSSLPSGSLLTLRALHHRDRREWEALRADNEAWLRPWEATAPQGGGAQMGFRQLVRYLDREGRHGRLQPFAVDVDGRLVGQMHLFGIAWGSMRSAAAGYWVAQSVAGQGITPLALAMATDFAMDGLGLHRVEVNIRPDNAASLRVVQKLGFRDEGVRTRYLHINGAWRDHRTFALTAEDLTGSTLVQRLEHTRHESDGRHTDAGPRSGG
jgi:[ribosomal protein S5]-alanine N-acetyltransferase